MTITFFVSGSIHSNFSHRALALARCLYRMGNDVSIVAPIADKYNNFTPKVVTEIDGVRILQPFQFVTKRIEINLIPYFFGAIWVLLTEKSDIVYIYKPTPISVVGLLAKLFRRTEVVADFDDLGSEVMKIEGHPWYRYKLVDFSEWLAKKYSDRLVVASSYLFDLFHKEYPTKPIKIIPNGVESGWFDTLIPSKKAKRIVFIGSVNRKSILEPLFEALSSAVSIHPDTEVQIIGDGEFLSFFKERAEQLNLVKNITFTGWLSLESTKMQLHTGDIGYCYMPFDITTRAASNMKVPQYMARAVVPFVSNVGDLSGTVDFGEAGYVCVADDINSITTTLIRALEDKDRLSRAARARRIALEKLNWDRLTETFINWIESERL
ncbi:MAG: glycosyltransferase [bacterium]|nr:glycosyltransferase [bacterium]